MAAPPPPQHWGPNPPPPPGMYGPPPPRRWPGPVLGLAIVGGLVGLVLVLGNTDAHNTCQTTLGQLGQGLSQQATEQCALASVKLHVGYLLLVAGIVALICAVIGMNTDPGRQHRHRYPQPGPRSGP